MVDWEKKRGRRKYKSLNILAIKRAFWMKKQAFFVIIEGLPFVEKSEKWQTQALKVVPAIFLLVCFVYLKLSSFRTRRIFLFNFESSFCS